jgi:GT2 family glycosyltransferase
MVQTGARLADLVSVTIAPRERHYSIIASLLSLFATIPPDVRVIVAQGDLPADLRQTLKDLQEVRRFELIETEYPLYPQEARNLGIEAVTTDYVVIADNDMQYEQGWLEALLANAIAHQSALVAPLIFIGPPRARTIHHAGGRLETIHANGVLKVREHHMFSNKDIAEVDIGSIGIDNHTVEFHCFLARRSFLSRLGCLDERLTTQEQIHYGLLTRSLGEKVTFEPGARVTYTAKTQFSDADLAYMSFRWNDWQATKAMDAIESAWGIDVEQEWLLSKWIRPHRMRAYGTRYPDQFRKVFLQDFYDQVAQPLEARAISRAIQLRRDKPLRFEPIEPPRRAETLESFALAHV